MKRNERKKEKELQGNKIKKNINEKDENKTDDIRIAAR